MIKKHSDDPNVEEAAVRSMELIKDVLSQLPIASSFDYGGQELQIGEYDVCAFCTTPIAESQQAQQALEHRATITDDVLIKEHLDLAAQLFRLEADAAVVRAEFHNGHGTEKILNILLGYQYERKIGDDYQHSHKGGN